MALSTQPSNPNFLNPINFRFVLHRAPTLNFFTIDATMPSVSLDAIYQATPFVQIPKPASKISFGRFNLTFKVDEDFVNYREIYDWMSYLGLREGYTDYAKNIDKETNATGTGPVSDCSLMILISSKKANIEVLMRDVFPTNLGNIEFAVDAANIRYASCRVEFALRDFVVIKL